MTILPGARVEVEAEHGTLTCRVANIQGRMLHLAVPSLVKGGRSVANGESVIVTLYAAGKCWDTQSIAREWVWGRAAILIVGPVEDWRERIRRRTVRLARELHATFTIRDGPQLFGRSRDFSSDGVSLMLDGADDLSDGACGTLTLRTHDDVWCNGLPMRVTHASNWLRPNGRALYVGAELNAPSEVDKAKWAECISRIGGEEP